MVLLGLQFVITLVVALFLQKLAPYYSLARWIMCSKLYRYLHPTNDQLKQWTGKPNNPTKGKRRKAAEKQLEPSSQLESFSIPCNLDVTLELVPVEEIDLYSQYKYQDYKWLVDFSVCASVVYVLIEAAAFWKPNIYTEEFNVGFVWCGLAVYFATKELFSLTAAYWRTDDSGERAMTISFGFFFFVMALGVLVINEEIMDFGLEKGYNEFASNLEVVLQKLNFNVRRAPSIWTFKVFLAVISALIGACIGFPGIRYANMHLDSIFYYQSNKLLQLLLHVAFFSPLFLLLLWVLPLSRDLLYTKGTKKGTTRPLMSNETYAFVRIHLFITFIVLRMLISRKLFQSHLNSACQKVAKLKRETGRITNLELQRTIARVFYYLSAAALQYLAPLLLMLYLGLMVRTLSYNMGETTRASNFKITEQAASEQKKEYAKLLRSLFSVKLSNGVCSYLAWWSLTTYFITTCFGFVYLKFLT